MKKIAEMAHIMAMKSGDFTRLGKKSSGEGDVVNLAGIPWASEISGVTVIE